jgi:hypothetical protein
MYLEEVGCESVKWIHLAQGSDQLKDLVNTVMCWGFREWLNRFGFSRGTHFHGVGYRMLSLYMSRGVRVVLYLVSRVGD